MADVILPSLGESVTEGIVTRWMKQVGEQVERDEPLYEISTDKVDSEMPAPAAGVLTEILVAEGDTVAVGARLAIISEDGAEVAAAPASSLAPATTSSAAPPAAAAPVTQGGSAVSSPFVRRALASAGLGATDIVGTGPGGRISRADVAAAPPSVQGSSGSDGAAWVAHRPAAVAFVALEARYDEVERALASEVASAAAADGVALDATVFALRAAVEALAEYPDLNAWAHDGELHIESSRNVGIDVEIEQGLVAPVIQDAQDLTLRGLARRMADVADRAATLSLGVDDLMGATFSVTRLPVDPVVLSIPSLRSPQVAALSVGAIRRQPVVIGDGDEEAVTIGSIGILGLAYDSAYVSPTQAAAFLSQIAALLERQDWTAQL